jgi:carboxymethylenebutenolidase
MPRFDLPIITRDGLCPASLFTPVGRAGPWPAVIFFMDETGIRPTLWEMGQRLADGGYLVLLPDLYYRLGSNPAMAPAEMRADPMKPANNLDRDRKISDAAAYIEFLLSRPEVAGDRFGAVGYGMGGNVSLTVAGAFPERFAAAASFHSGSLVTDEWDSPHLFVKYITSRVYVAGADGDASFTAGQKYRFKQALIEARVDHLVETYPGALHGFAVPDATSFDRFASERHWATLLKLFQKSFSLEL